MNIPINLNPLSWQSFKKRMFVCSLLAFLIFSKCAFNQEIQIQRIEPPFWWVGMKDPGLQLLLYGPNVGLLKAETDNRLLRITEVTTAISPNYLFIDLVIDPEAIAGRYPITLTLKGKVFHQIEYELRPRKEGSARRKGFDQSDAIYLLFPDRFANGDPTNDTHPDMLEKVNRTNPNGRHGGDIQGILKHLDYIADLGFTAIWINPLLENNQPAYSYHGYAITDFYRIDPRFGTNEQYVTLVYAMHQKGLKIIQDMIFNHCGSEHWWMKDQPWPDWIHHWPEFTRSNFRGSTVFDPYASLYDREHFQKGWFDTNMPDLNQKNPFLLNYLIQNSIWWIEYADLDGIRMDTYPYPFQEAMAQWAERIFREYPDFSVVGEAWLTEPGQVAVWQKGNKLQTGYESFLSHVFDFPLYESFRYALIEPAGWNTGIMRFYHILSQDYLYSAPQNLVVFADNHDGSRILNKVGGDPARVRLALAFVGTTRGIPQVYYGTEILMDGDETKGHGDIRKDFPGGWPDDTSNAFTKQGLTATESEMHQFVRTLFNWRKHKPVIHSGKLTQFVPENNVYVYFRHDENDTVMVILNNNTSEIRLNQQRFQELTKGFSAGVNIFDQKSYPLHQLNVPGKTALILELVR